MAWMTYSAADFLAALRAILPGGDVWNDDPASVQGQVLSSFMPAFERVAAANVQLMTEAIPSSTEQLLPDWEASTGLPDPCAGLSPTIEQRRDQVVARLAATGGQSAPYFIEVAENLGYDITITQFAPARAGQTHAGQRCCGPAWAYAWQVNAPTFTITRARAGQTVAGDRIAAWGNTVLQCELQRLSPAHTELLFSYD